MGSCRFISRLSSLPARVVFHSPSSDAAYPLAYLACNNADSGSWNKNFIQTLLERNRPKRGVRVAMVLRRFWTMLAHYREQTWSAAEPARPLSVSQVTMRRYLDILTDAFMIRQLQFGHLW